MLLELVRKKAVNHALKTHRTACKSRVQFQQSEEDLQEQVERLKLYKDNQTDTIAESDDSSLKSFKDIS